MSLVFDIFQGIGIAAAVGIRPFLPGLAAGALAAGERRDPLRPHELQFSAELLVPAGAARRARCCSWCSTAPRSGRACARRPMPTSLMRDLAWGSAGCSSPASCAAAATPSGPAGSAASPAPRSAIAASRPFLERAAPRLDAAAAAVGLPLIARGLGARDRRPFDRRAPDRADRAAGADLAAVPRPRARRAEVRGAADPAMTRVLGRGSLGAMRGNPKKLVLVVIDALKPEMLERAISTGRAPALQRICSRTASTSTTAWRRFRPSRPSAPRRSRRASYPDQHLIPEHELVPPRGGPLRRVRLELLRDAPVRCRCAR